ncbi:MAG: carbohydrate kinase [Pseudomonadota bacterium]
MTILVCGEALYDVFFEDERAEGFTLDARIGGSAFNVAIGLGRMGQAVGLLTGVSRDRLGDKLAATLAEERVQTGYLSRKHATTTLAMVSLGAGGSAEYQFYGEGAADRQVVEPDLPDPAPMSAAVFGCFSLVTKPTGDSFLLLAERMAKANRLVVLDPNVRLNVEPDPAVWRARVEAFATHAGLIKVSAEDLESLYPDEAAEDVAKRWIEGGSAAVVVTQGGDGARIFTASVSKSVPAREATVVDTVGAGDSFLAALLTFASERNFLSRDGFAGLSEEVAREALSFAACAASLTCERRGADLPLRGNVSASPLPD